MISKAAPFDGLFDGKCEWKKVFVYQYQYLRRSIDNRMGVTLEGFLNCQTIAQAKTVASALPEHIRLTREEPGCVRFDVTATKDPLVWTVSEAFVDAAAFEAHQTRTAASAWAQLTKDIPRAYTVTGLP